MKTAKQICDDALALLGYTDRIGAANGENFSPHWRAALNICNLVINEIQRREGKEYKGITALTDTPDISERSINEVMPYGVAMHMSLIDQDFTMHEHFTTVYSEKLSLPKKSSKTVTLKYKPME